MANDVARDAGAVSASEHSEHPTRSRPLRAKIPFTMRKPFAVAILMLAVFSSEIRAQVLYGSLVGTVTDQSGSSIPGAMVTITQAETNQSREGITSETGTYTFSNVAPGTYEVTVTLPGFQTFLSKGILVRQNTAVRVDATLRVGALQDRSRCPILRRSCRLKARPYNR